MSLSGIIMDYVIECLVAANGLQTTVYIGLVSVINMFSIQEKRGNRR